MREVAAAIRPILFVVIPFGRKRDLGLAHEIDFDRVYEDCIRPAGEEAGFEVIRADEERSGGIVHLAMFERLLLAEVVIADVTMANANVFYELGIRHCARPRSTLLIRARETRLPFDVTMIRAAPYTLHEGIIRPEEAARFKSTLTTMLGHAQKDLDSRDSPLFQLIGGFPGINLAPKSAASFRARVDAFEAIRARLEAARGTRNSAEVRVVEDLVMAERGWHAPLLSEIAQAYKDLEKWDDVVRFIEALPSSLSTAIFFQQTLAFALNRRNALGDRDKTTRILRKIVQTHGADPETCGLLGRVYKDLYEESVRAGSQTADGYLDEAIAVYRQGFEADPRDPYPGINLATLLRVKGIAIDDPDFRLVSAAVMFATGRRGGIASSNYWDVATAMEIAALVDDWPLAGRAAQRFKVLQPPRWAIQSASRNLNLLLTKRPTPELSSLMQMLSSDLGSRS